jgi:fatty acid desaturase
MTDARVREVEWRDLRALSACSFMFFLTGLRQAHNAQHTAFFAVWTVHHGCERDRGPIARTIRGRVKALISYEMFFHVEHHLYPGVPTSRLPALARRLDAVAPELAARRVF